ncbi:MAG TPA: zinc ribbon domain-containing protein [Gaiellaceae bacterium]|nr:zinc ribbon domain-containing protein [Gaiellaceae bacterium]
MSARVFSSGTGLAVRNAAILVGVVFWLSLVFWTYKDARRRIDDPFLIALAVLVALVLPFIGPFVYMLFRPPEYLEEVRERQLELRAIEERLSAGDSRCPVCRAEIDPSFLVCPVCTTKLRQACTSCNAPLEPIWQVCPYCETPIEPAAAAGGPPVLGTQRPPRRDA